MNITGLEGLSPEQIRAEVQRGGRFVIYTWVVSILVMTFKRGTDITFIRANESAVVPGLPWTFLTLVAGWWGIPWGLIYTPMALVENLGGGKDVTREVMASLGLEGGPEQVASAPPPGPAAAPPSSGTGTPGDLPPRYGSGESSAATSGAPGAVSGDAQAPGAGGSSPVPSPRPGVLPPGFSPAPELDAGLPYNPQAARLADQLGGFALGAAFLGFCCFPLGLGAMVLGGVSIAKAKEAKRSVPVVTIIALVLAGLSMVMPLVALLARKAQ